MVSETVSSSVEQRVEMNAVDLTSRTPVTLIAGSPGSGKSTLLNRIINAYSGTRFGVVLNDFGRLALQGGVIRPKQHDVVECMRGGLLRKPSNDVPRAVRRVARRRHEIDQVLVEAPGLMDPQPAIRYFLEGSGRRRFELGAVVCVLDAARIEYTAATYEIVFTQLKQCDFVYLTRVSELATSERQSVEGFLAAHAPQARLLTDEPDRETEMLFAIGGIDAAARGLPEVGGGTGEPLREYDTVLEGVQPHGDSRDTRTGSVDSLLFEVATALDEGSFRSFLSHLPSGILRAKGMVYLSSAENRNVEHLLQIAGSRVALDARKHGKARDTTTRVLFLGRGLDKERLRARLESCVSGGGHPE